jgi:hypothetical protein
MTCEGRLEGGRNVYPNLENQHSNNEAYEKWSEWHVQIDHAFVDEKQLILSLCCR